MNPPTAAPPPAPAKPCGLTQLTLLLLLLLLLLATAPGPLSAQALRDPTKMPEVATAADPENSTTAAPQVLRQLLVVNGRRYAVDGSRLYGVGDAMGGARIERIEDAAIVVRDARGVRRLPLHSGVVKSPVYPASGGWQQERPLTP